MIRKRKLPLTLGLLDLSLSLPIYMCACLGRVITTELKILGLVDYQVQFNTSLVYPQHKTQYCTIKKILEEGNGT